jgi:hypothetical protein
MAEATSRLKRDIRRGAGAAYEKKVLIAMMMDFISEGNRFIEECTGRKSSLNGSLDSIKDDIDGAFYALVEAEEQAEEDRRDPWLRDAARADRRMEEAR